MPGVVGENLLFKELTYVKGVGPQKAQLLKGELQANCIRDLLMHFPYRHIDRTTFQHIRYIKRDGEDVQIRGVLSGVKKAGSGRGMRLKAKITDGTGSAELVWFKGIHTLSRMLKPGEDYVAFGRVKFYKGRWNIPHPELKSAAEYDAGIEQGLVPVYSTTEKLVKKGLDSKGLRRIILNIFKEISAKDLPEHLPQYLVSKLRLLDIHSAMLQIHFPDTHEQLERARNRMIFEEFFISQLHIVEQYLQRRSSSKGYRFATVGKTFHRFYGEKLPFSLTKAQKKVVKEIRSDLNSGHQMNRLLQGDVGSGKTVVSLMTMLLAIDNGFQSCLMAPTSILAEQHYQSIYKLTRGLGVQVALLTSAVKGRKRKEILQLLSTGSLHILIGTHAVIEDHVKFHNLGLAIIDEQHRFGVAQRAKLWRKGKLLPPHILVMTATPIPRTLHMTTYGALDISIIDELPPGRKPVRTIHKTEFHRPEVIKFMRQQIDLGNQVYVVYPLIDESEFADLEDLNNGYEKLLQHFPSSHYQISVVHGRMKPEEKEYEVNRFKNRKTQIMVATTVIEVGVDIPNANVMIIENSSRFGLSQLHQLRGRIGRGTDQAYCVLMTRSGESKNERIQVMLQTNDGFEIAEADLRLRGPGMIEGTQQSGLPQFRIANILEHKQELKIAQAWARHILKSDPELSRNEHLPLKHHLITYYSKGKKWGKIS